jgi:hypothetical protein
MPKFFVNVYAVDREMGGPEEGGWSFETGEPVETEVCFTEGWAYVRRERLEVKFPDRGYRHSVVPRGRDFIVRVEDEPGKVYPEVWPHYE